MRDRNVRMLGLSALTALSFGASVSNAIASPTRMILLSGKGAVMSRGKVQQDTYIDAVKPGKDVLLAMFAEINSGDCTEISPGAWTIDTQPQYGVAHTRDVKAMTNDGVCSGIVFTFAAIFYTLDKGSTQSSDTFNATYTSPDYNIPATFDLVAPTISIVSENISTNSIVVDPEPANLSGALTITVIGDKGSPVVAMQNVTGGSPVNLSYNENTSPLPPSRYKSLKASWALNGLNFETSRPVNFTALGLYENTQYNSPHEASCSGKETDAVTLYDLSNNTCMTNQSDFKPEFRTQVNINGTGYDISDTFTAIEQFCVQPPKKILMNKAFRSPYSLMTYCEVHDGSNNRIDDTTIAVSFSKGAPFQCGDNVLFVGENPNNGAIGTTKTVTDECPACKKSEDGTQGHVDNYTTSPDCTKVPSLPNYQAIIIGR